MEYHNQVVPPPSPPSSSFTDDEKQLHVAPLFDDSTTDHLISCDDNVDKAQHHFKSQRGALFRSATAPPPSLQHPRAIMECHRLAIEALQNLYAEERRRNALLEEQTRLANEKITKLQQELSRQKRTRSDEHRELQRVYGLADMVWDVSSCKKEKFAPPKPASPAELHSCLRHILTNVSALHHHAPSTGSLVVNIPEQDAYYY
ncbi:hypothetical protein BJV82DRAFT_613761 [Fennellomyces sp. T-0311]|nr:hypothetical protein BJV82DRAFT_613761 [Fennellomyces sp. T-0311]